MNIKFYMVDTHACGHYRGEVVAREVNGQCSNNRMDCKTNILFSDYAGTHLMVFQRQIRNLENVQLANQRGIATIYEIDDDIWGIPSIFEDYGKECFNPENSEKIMAACDAITVTTPELAEVVRAHVPGKVIYVIPNAIDLDMWDEVYMERQVKPPAGPDGQVVIGWMASQSHLMDVPLVGEVLRDLMAEFKQLRLHFIGWVGLEAFMGDIMRPFKDRIVCGDWVPVSQLARAMSDFDIGILPLIDHPWNRSKSDLKFLQYSCLGIPSVASPMPCYQRNIEPGAGLIVENNAPEDWYKNLKMLITDVKLRQVMGARARQLMYLKHDIRRGFQLWMDVFEAVRSKR